MSTVTIPRSDVTVEEVSGVLRDSLGSHYKVTPFADSNLHHETSGYADSILVKRNWLERANIRILPGTNTTEIKVSAASAFTFGGFLINRIGITRKVHQVLEHSAELAVMT
jgi:hypothetical protein